MCNLGRKGIWINITIFTLTILEPFKGYNVKENRFPTDTGKVTMVCIKQPIYLKVPSSH